MIRYLRGIKKFNKSDKFWDYAMKMYIFILIISMINSIILDGLFISKRGLFGIVTSILLLSICTRLNEYKSKTNYGLFTYISYLLAGLKILSIFNLFFYISYEFKRFILNLNIQAIQSFPIQLGRLGSTNDGLMLKNLFTYLSLFIKEYLPLISQIILLIIVLSFIYLGITYILTLKLISSDIAYIRAVPNLFYACCLMIIIFIGYNKFYNVFQISNEVYNLLFLITKNILYLTIFLFMVVVVKNILKFSNVFKRTRKDFKATIIFNNLKVEKIFDSGVFMVGKGKRDLVDGRILEVNIKPENMGKDVCIESIDVFDYTYVNNNNKTTTKEIWLNTFYILLPKLNKEKYNVDLRLKFHVNDQKKMKVFRSRLFLSFVCSGSGEISLSENYMNSVYQVYFYGEIAQVHEWLMTVKKISRRIAEKIGIFESDLILGDAILNNIYFNQSTDSPYCQYLTALDLKDINSDRKFLLNSGKFGSGKSTLDNNVPLQHGLNVVEINFWKRFKDSSPLIMLYSQLRNLGFKRKFIIGYEYLITSFFFIGSGYALFTKFLSYVYPLESLKSLAYKDIRIKEIFISLGFKSGFAKEIPSLDKTSLLSEMIHVFRKSLLICQLSL